MKPRIIRQDLAGEYHTPERCFICETWGSDDDPELSVARARVPAGVVTQLHALEGVAERYLVVQGSGLMEVGGLEAREVAAGDMVIIPAGTPQRIRNTGAGDLVFYCLCSPRFTPDCYRALE